MYNRAIILITIESVLGGLNIIRNIEGMKEIRISIIIVGIYIIINRWIKSTMRNKDSIINKYNINNIIY